MNSRRSFGLAVVVVLCLVFSGWAEATTKALVGNSQDQDDVTGVDGETPALAAE
jgi:hypothetical protein